MAWGETWRRNTASEFPHAGRYQADSPSSMNAISVCDQQLHIFRGISVRPQFALHVLLKLFQVLSGEELPELCRSERIYFFLQVLAKGMDEIVNPLSKGFTIILRRVGLQRFNKALEYTEGVKECLVLRDILCHTPWANLGFQEGEPNFFFVMMMCMNEVVLLKMQAQSFSTELQELGGLRTMTAQYPKNESNSSLPGWTWSE